MAAGRKKSDAAAVPFAGVRVPREGERAAVERFRNGVLRVRRGNSPASGGSDGYARTASKTPAVMAAGTGILLNRQSAARSKRRKMRYIQELERKAQVLQTETTMLQRDSAGQATQNNKMKIRMQARATCTPSSYV